MFKKKILFPTILTILFLAAIPVFAYTQRYFDSTNQFYSKICTTSATTSSSIQIRDQVLCFLIEKSRENDALDATQSAQISDLEKRVNTLEHPSPSPVACLTPPSGLISWWTGDNTVNDLENINNGSINSGTTYGGGEVGSAFSFNGTDGMMQSSTNNLPAGNSDRTLELWVKVNSFLADVADPSSNQEAFFAGYGNFGVSSQIYVLGTAGNVLFFSSWGGVIFGPSLQTNKWYHVAITNIGNQTTLYLNGTSVSNGTVTINTPTGTSFYLGRAPGSFGDIRRLNGLVDEAAIYNRALSAPEIQSIYNVGTGGKCKI